MLSSGSYCRLQDVFGEFNNEKSYLLLEVEIKANDRKIGQRVMLSRMISCRFCVTDESHSAKVSVT